MGTGEPRSLQGQPLLSNLQTLGEGDLCGAEMSGSFRAVVRLAPSPFEQLGEGVSSPKLRRPVSPPPPLPGW